jgi:putative holliday junction resolvase
MRVLGIDPGSRRIGLAISDESGLIAMPLAALAVSGAAQVVAKLAAEVARLSAERVVVGLPLRLDGRESDAARSARRLSSQLAEASGLEVVLWDERLTTKAAERALREGGVRGEKRRAAVDSIAAALILQSYLDAEIQRDERDDI